MAYLQSLLALHSLDINDSNVAEKCNEWKEMWLLQSQQRSWRGSSGYLSHGNWSCGDESL